MLCSAKATDDVSPPIRKRTQKRTLRGGSTREADFDPFIGVARALSSETIQKSTGRNMSLSIPTKSTPTSNTAVAFIDETDVPAAPSSSTTSPATPKPTFVPTSVMLMEGEGWFLSTSVELEEESGTEMPVRSRQPTLLPTPYQLI